MFEVNPGIIDSEKLLERVEMSAIKAKVPSKYFSGYENKSEKEIQTKKINNLFSAIRQNIEGLRAIYAIEERPIVYNRPIIRKPVILVRKIYRKMTRWIFASYYQQQTVINERMLDTMSKILELQEMLQDTYEQEREKK